MTTTHEALWPKPMHVEMVRDVLAAGPDRILALHVDEAHRGASIPVRRAFEQTGIEVQELNRAYEAHDLIESLGRHRDVARALPRIFEGQAMRIVYMTGWGSDPRSADALLKAVYPHVAMRPNLRLVVMNNASPIPPMFTSAGPTAHPTAEGFAAHVAVTTGVSRTQVDVHDLKRDDFLDVQD